jgi:soluble lytic murein transglycosylase-like protein
LEEKMSLGPRLVIPGTIFSSILMAFFLYTITAGFNFPQPVLAASPAEEAAAVIESEAPAAVLVAAAAVDEPSEPEAAAQEPAAEEAGEEHVPAVVTALGDVQNCDVSDKFPQSILQWCDLITRYSHERGLPPDLIAALIWQESGGNPTAYSKSGAVGLMQVMPKDGLAASFMCKNGPCFANRPTTASLKDPEFNVQWGTNFLAGLIRHYGTTRDALKAYGPMDVGYYYADKVLGIYQRYGK